MFGLTRTSKHNQRMVQAQSDLLEAVDETKKEYQRRIDLEWNLALGELSAQLRTLFVDLNYELFTTDSSMVKNRLYGFLATALHQFHDKNIRKITKPEEEENARSTTTWTDATEPRGSTTRTDLY